MEEFIKAITQIDNEMQKEIIKKLNKKEKLKNYELYYLKEIKRLVEKYKVIEKNK